MASLTPAQNIEAALRAGKLASEALQLQGMRDTALMELQLREVAQQFNDMVKFLEKVKQQPTPQ